MPRRSKNWRSLGGCHSDEQKPRRTCSSVPRRRVSEEHKKNRADLQEISANIKVIEKAVDEILHAASEAPSRSKRSSDTDWIRKFSIPPKIQSGRYTEDDMGMTSTDYTEMQYYQDMAKISLEKWDKEWEPAKKASIITLSPVKKASIVTDYERIIPKTLLSPEQTSDKKSLLAVPVPDFFVTKSPDEPSPPVLITQNASSIQIKPTPTEHSLMSYKSLTSTYTPSRHRHGSMSHQRSWEVIDTIKPKIKSYPVKAEKEEKLTGGRRRQKVSKHVIIKQKKMTYQAVDDNPLGSSGTTIEWRWRDMEAISVQHESFKLLKPMDDDVKRAVVLAPDKIQDPKAEYVTRKLRLASITDEDNSDKLGLVNKAWEQLLLQSFGRDDVGLCRKNRHMCSTLQTIKDELINMRLRQELICASKLRSSAKKIRAFHLWMEQKGFIMPPHLVFYGDTEAKRFEIKNRRVKEALSRKTLSKVKIEQLRLKLLRTGLPQGIPTPSSLSLPLLAVNQKSLLMTGLTDGTRVIYYGDGAPAIIQSRSKESGFYFIIYGNVSHWSPGLFRGIITPSGSCSIYYPSDHLWYIHSGRVGLLFDEEHRTLREWSALENPPTTITLKLNENITVRICSGYNYEITFCSGEEKVILKTGKQKGVERFTFDNPQELRDKYGYLSMPNNYTSFAARDHRPYLKTGVQDPIDQAIPEGYQVMRRQANEARTHDVEILRLLHQPILRSAPQQSSRISRDSDESMIDVFIKKRPITRSKQLIEYSTTDMLHMVNSSLKAQKSKHRGSTRWSQTKDLQRKSKRPPSMLKKDRKVRSEIAKRKMQRDGKKIPEHPFESEGSTISSREFNVESTESTSSSEDYIEDALNVSERVVSSTTCYTDPGTFLLPKIMLAQKAVQDDGLEADKRIRFENELTSTEDDILPSQMDMRRNKSTCSYLTQRPRTSHPSITTTLVTSPPPAALVSVDVGGMSTPRNSVSHAGRTPIPDSKLIQKRNAQTLFDLSQTRRTLIDSRNWFDDDPLMHHYNEQRAALTNRVNQALHNWSATLLQYLGMSQRFANTLSGRMISTAKKEYRMLTISDLKGQIKKKKPAFPIIAK